MGSGEFNTGGLPSVGLPSHPGESRNTPSKCWSDDPLPLYAETLPLQGLKLKNP